MMESTTLNANDPLGALVLGVIPPGSERYAPSSAFRIFPPVLAYNSRENAWEVADETIRRTLAAHGLRRNVARGHVAAFLV